MVNFQLTMGGYEVSVNDQHIGWLSQERGFFTDPTVIKKFIEISCSDLRHIAQEAEALQKTGYLYIPTNSGLGG
jgi:hypothetical protein